MSSHTTTGVSVAGWGTSGHASDALCVTHTKALVDSHWDSVWGAYVCSSAAALGQRLYVVGWVLER